MRGKGGGEHLRLVPLLVMRRRQTKPFEMANVKFKWDVSYMLATTTTAHALFSARQMYTVSVAYGA